VTSASRSARPVQQSGRRHQYRRLRRRRAPVHLDAVDAIDGQIATITAHPDVVQPPSEEFPRLLAQRVRRTEILSEVGSTRVRAALPRRQVEADAGRGYKGQLVEVDGVGDRGDEGGQDCGPALRPFRLCRRGFVG